MRWGVNKASIRPITQRRVFIDKGSTWVFSVHIIYNKFRYVHYYYGFFLKLPFRLLFLCAILLTFLLTILPYLFFLRSFFCRFPDVFFALPRYTCNRLPILFIVFLNG